MRSIRTKITILTLCATIIVLTVTTFLAVFSIKDLGNSSANQILFLLCEEGQKNLDFYFKSVEQSVETIAEYVETDLSNTDISQLNEHINRVDELFDKMANNTKGVLTYYYRIDPEVSQDAKGFWYVNLDGNGFQEHEVTDISLYDTKDMSNLVWFTVPKANGTSVWLPPYVTDNLDVYVLSYNVPIYKNKKFIGVIGIEIDYNILSEPVNSITLYDNGYAFINDYEGNIIYHPHMNIADLTGENKPKVPDNLLDDDPYVSYTYEGVEKKAVWLPLDNGMRLNVTVPISEINDHWQHLIMQIIFTSAIILLILVIFTIRLTKHITGPLRKLTEAAKQVDAGDYNIELDYDGKDEIGILTRTFDRTISHLRKYIKDLNDLAYSDPLTSVHNKGAFDIYIEKLESQVLNSDEKPEFAIGIFDCNDLKPVNDKYGHEKGDIYLKTAVSLICKVFKHSPVFRIGGDEFALILQKEDYRRREDLVRVFMKQADRICNSAAEQWEQVDVALGIAVYDPKEDSSVHNVIQRADKLMYKNKYLHKK